MRGLYVIKNKINNEKYIGESLNIRRRWKEHLMELNNNSHHSYKLQQDWNAYGRENFEFKIMAVLDDDIENFIDKYILVCYESLLINKYNTIENGYNVEDTFNKVMLGEKSLSNNNEDSKLLKTYYKKIKNKEIISEGGIIFENSFDVEDIKNELNLNEKNEVKGLMYNNNLLNYFSKNKYKLNEDIIDTKDIICNADFKKIKINENAFDKICSILKDVINKGNDVYSFTPKKANVNDVETIKTIEVTDYMESMTDFFKNFEFLKGYNRTSVFQFLRDSEILKYVVCENDKRYNVPTKNYTEYFICKEIVGKDFKKYYRLQINRKGKMFLYKTLTENGLINEAQYIIKQI